VSPTLNKIWLYRSAALFVLFLTFCGYAFSKLVFSPVPWPDGSAFYLPSLDLFSWPPLWKMHSQAAFVPTYDTANYNMMPLLPAILGLFTRLGLGQVFGGPLAIKMISLGGLVLFAWHLWDWILKRSGSIWIASAVGLAALWDPVNRWGTLVVRSEIWIGLFWILILKKLGEMPTQSRRCVWISLYLALAAYTHFEAIILVPATIVGLFPFRGANLATSRAPKWAPNWTKEWLRDLVRVGIFTGLFLLPWGVYVLAHFRLFLEQMHTQFFRLGGANYWVSSPYLIFHSLFLELGSPTGVAKFFNVAKAVFWLLIFTVTGVTAYAMSLRKNNGLELMVASGVAFWVSFYLWCTKPEVWFITLCHLMLWPWVGASLTWARNRANSGFAVSFRGGFSKNPVARVLMGGAIVYSVFSLVANAELNRRINPKYSWNIYRQWVGCIERAVLLGHEKEHPRVWQPHLPDILVELSSRRPNWDLTRTLDFEALRGDAWKFTEKADAIVMSRFLNGAALVGPVASPAMAPALALTGNPRKKFSLDYEGPERAQDRKLVETELDQPFGPWILERLPQEQPGQWSRHVCQRGPFFADVAVRESLPLNLVK